MLTTLLTQQGGQPPIVVVDTSDILNRKIRRLREEEENVAAQILQSRQKRPPKESKKQIDWRNLLLQKINKAETIEQLDAIKIDTVDVQITARILEAIEKHREVRRLQIEIAEKQAEVRRLELQAEVERQKAEEFTKKRNNRIKRLKALMWLAKLDL